MATASVGADEWRAASRARDISVVFLLAPTSTDERIRRTAELTDSFIYAVSLTGTTGARQALYAGLPEFLGRIKAVTDKPVVVGFGISAPEHVRALRGHADGIVVASRIIDAIRRGEEWTGLGDVSGPVCTSFTWMRAITRKRESS